MQTRAVVEDLVERVPEIVDAFWTAMLLEHAITCEWVVNVGVRMALERIAHLFCEIFTRLESMGLVVGSRCMLPLRQIHDFPALREAAGFDARYLEARDLRIPRTHAGARERRAFSTWHSVASGLPALNELVSG